MLAQPHCRKVRNGMIPPVRRPIKFNLGIKLKNRAWRSKGDKTTSGLLTGVNLLVRFESIATFAVTDRRVRRAPDNDLAAALR